MTGPALHAYLELQIFTVLSQLLFFCKLLSFSLGRFFSLLSLHYFVSRDQHFIAVTARMFSDMGHNMVV